VKIYELIIDPEREDHIARHGVSIEEVEQVVFGQPFIRRTRQERLRLLGQTDAGRYLAVFLGAREAGAYGLITARDATNIERRQYREHKRRI
jgi:uncharacterized DUF497 family protein